MAAIKVGHQVVYHSEHGDVPAWVIEYDEGHAAGDYRIGGFSNQAALDAGQGPYFNTRSVFGEEQGAFSTL
jgi:hypothetical protein